MLGVTRSAYFKVRGNQIVFNRDLHSYEECPGTKGYTRDRSGTVVGSGAPFRVCGKCTQYTRALNAEAERRKIASGEYRRQGHVLIHTSCDKPEDDCRCYDL